MVHFATLGTKCAKGARWYTLIFSGRRAAVRLVIVATKGLSGLCLEKQYGELKM